MLFFFQAEDGIRDKLVTGVQTCALPISFSRGRHRLVDARPRTSATVPRRGRQGVQAFCRQGVLSSRSPRYGSLCEISVRTATENRLLFPAPQTIRQVDHSSTLCPCKGD